MLTAIGFFVPSLAANSGLRWFLAAILMVGAAVGVLHACIGWSLKDISKRVEKSLADRVHRRSLERLGEDERDPSS
ncbi:MAG: hypothetical protein ACYDHU_05075 [Acidimicrobiales bacterium]